jgi:hypothetical protein
MPDYVESQLDAYKRGAFLEKTHRFSKEKPSDVPGLSCKLMPKLRIKLKPEYDAQVPGRIVQK